MGHGLITHPHQAETQTRHEVSTFTQTRELFVGQDSRVAGQHQLTLHLLGGCVRHLRESGQVPPGSLRASFRQVGWN